jgi:hypothetical protein
VLVLVGLADVLALVVVVVETLVELLVDLLLLPVLVEMDFADDSGEETIPLVNVEPISPHLMLENVT